MEEVIVVERSDQEIALEINTIKRKTAHDMIASAVEIGRLLCEAKEKVPHGSWGDWLRDNVSYSVRNATNMMRLYEEHDAGMLGSGEANVFEGLNLSQAIALLAVPREERRQFIEENNVQDLSVKETQALIREKEEIEKRLREAEEGREEAEVHAAEAKALSEKYEQELIELREQPIPEEARAELVAELTAKFKKEKDELAQKHRKALSEASAKEKRAVEKAKKDAQDAFALEREEIRTIAKKEAEEAMRQRVEAAEARLKELTVASSPYLVRFKLYMEALQSSYQSLTQTVEEAEASEPEVGKSLRTALSQIRDAL